MKYFTIFGDPVAHSISPLMHNYLFSHLNIKACYSRVCLKNGADLKKMFLELKLNGANITVPYKEDAYLACDKVRGFAKKAKAVNTIVLEDGKLVGYNTDADGFILAIKEFKNINKVLILGAGGTAKALANRLIDDGVNVTILNRSKTRLQYFKKNNITNYTWDEFDAFKTDLVINTTSAGLEDNNLPVPKQLLKEILSQTSFACDIIYGKKTPFLQLVLKNNIPYKDGLDMLVNQGALASYLFCDKQISVDKITKILKQAVLLK